MEYIRLLIRSLALSARPERHEGIDLTAASTRASFKSFRDTTSETGCPLAGEGSNLRPPDPESGVLPTELPANGFRVSQRQCPSSSASQSPGVRGVWAIRREWLARLDLNQRPPPCRGGALAD